MKDNQIDKLFSEGLTDKEVSASGQGWSTLEAMLDEKPQSKVFGWFWAALAVLIVLVAGSWLIWSVQPSAIRQPYDGPMAESKPDIREENNISSNTKVNIDASQEEVRLISIPETSALESVNIELATDYISTTSVDVLSTSQIAVNDANVTEQVNRRRGVAALKPLQIAPIANLYYELSVLPIRVVEVPPIVTSEPTSRKLIVQLGTRHKSDTIVLKTPDLNKDKKPDVLAAIKVVRSESGILQKVRDAKNNLFNKSTN